MSARRRTFDEAGRRLLNEDDRLVEVVTMARVPRAGGEGIDEAALAMARGLALGGLRTMLASFASPCSPG